MKKIYLYIAIVIILGLLTWVYIKYGDKSEPTQEAPTSPVVSPAGDQAPDLNPIDKTNPFNKYQNPF